MENNSAKTSSCESIYYRDLDEKQLKFNSTIDEEEGKKLLQKLYTDILCQHEIGVREKDEEKNLKSRENNSQLCNNISLYPSTDEKNEYEELQKDIKVFYKPKKINKFIYYNICNNQKYCFLTEDFEKKEKKDNCSFHKKGGKDIAKYEYIYAKFEEIENIEDQQKIIKDKKLFFYEGEETYLKSNQLAIFIDSDSKVNCIGSTEMKQKLEKILSKEFKISHTGEERKSTIIGKNVNELKFKDKILESTNFEYETIEVLLVNNTTKINKYIKSELHLYTDITCNNPKETKNYYYQIKLSKIQGDYIVKNGNEKYYKYNEKNEKYSCIESTIFSTYLLENLTKEEITDNSILLRENNNFRPLKNHSLKKKISIKSVTIDIAYNLELKDEMVNENHIIMVDYSPDYKNDYAMILARLRNAVAHARVKLECDFLIFENKVNEKVNLIAKIHKDKICDFIDELHDKLK